MVVRVRELRDAASAYVDEVEGSIERMEAARAAIAERQEALAASRATLEAREAELRPRRTSAASSLPSSRARSGASSGRCRLRLRRRWKANRPRRRRPRTWRLRRGRGHAQLRWHRDGSGERSGGGQGRDRRRQRDLRHAVPVGRRPRVVRVGRLRLLGVGQLRAPRRRLPRVAARLDRLHDLGRERPREWITVYSNPGHAYIVIAGLRFDTSGGAGPRWQGPRDPAGFVATHPPGY